MGVLRSAAHRRAESRFWGVFIIAVHRAFVLGLGARHRGIVKLSEDRRVGQCSPSLLTYLLTHYTLENKHTPSYTRMLRTPYEQDPVRVRACARATSAKGGRGASA